MAYDEGLAARARRLLEPRDGIVEKKMFGGLAFLLDRNLCVGVREDELMVRVPPEQHDALLAKPHACVLDLTGRPMAGWLLIGAEGLRSGPALKRWVEIGARFASTLPTRR
ncbi:MAG: TfoX/Sxy family protein [Chloroflexi bacterium]|nr:TfoX/Sxy family protein [Chloroflexota bacterium]